MSDETLVVRLAGPGDLPKLLAIERQVASDSSSGRGDACDNPAESGLPGVVAAGECWVALLGGGLAGYAVMHRRFFHAGFVDSLIVAEPLRRRGVGSALLRHLAECCTGPKLWTSTNLSNTPMQALLAREGFAMSGFVEGLDEGDPELVYSKRLSAGAAPPGSAGLR